MIPAWLSTPPARYAAAVIVGGVLAWTVQGFRLDAVRAELATAVGNNKQCVADVAAVRDGWAEYWRQAEARVEAAKKAQTAAQVEAAEHLKTAQYWRNLPRPTGDVCGATRDMLKDYAKGRR